jgi:hypothetical protein
MGRRRATERVETGTAGGLLHEQGGGPGGDLTPLGAVAVDREKRGLEGIAPVRHHARSGRTTQVSRWAPKGMPSSWPSTSWSVVLLKLRVERFLKLE